jgi:hypothetical protein
MNSDSNLKSKDIAAAYHGALAAKYLDDDFHLPGGVPALSRALLRGLRVGEGLVLELTCRGDL